MLKQMGEMSMKFQQSNMEMQPDNLIFQQDMEDSRIILQNQNDQLKRLMQKAINPPSNINIKSSDANEKVE